MYSRGGMRGQASKGGVIVHKPASGDNDQALTGGTGGR